MMLISRFASQEHFQGGIFCPFKVHLFSEYLFTWGIWGTFIIFWDCVKSLKFHTIFIFTAVRSGDVTKFEVVRAKYVDQFKADRTFTLILRLHHNVIKTAIRR